MKQSRAPIFFRMFSLAMILTLICGWLSTSISNAATEESEVGKKEVLEVIEDTSRQGAAEKPKTVTATPLSLERLKQLASMLPSFATPTNASRKFVLPSYTKRPPAVNDVIELPFPGKSSNSSHAAKTSPSPPATSREPVKVASINYQGLIDGDAMQLQITFNQPMIPITTTENSDTMLPVTLIPQPPGAWHWLDTKTIAFEPKGDRFPYATTYRVVIPKGTASALGQLFESRYESSFETRPPAITSGLEFDTEPDNAAVSLKPMFYVFANQRIDADQVIRFVRGTSASGDFKFRVATADEVKKAHPQLYPQQITNEKNGLNLWFLPEKELPRNSSFKIRFEPGFPGIEGPNTSKELQTFGFDTYHPLAPLITLDAKHQFITRSNTGVNIPFNNRLEVTKFRKDYVQISPSIPNFEVSTPGGSYIAISGQLRIGTIYKVTLKKEITDQHGQSLQKDVSLRVKVMAATPQIYMDEKGFIQILPSAKPVIQVRTLNERSLKVSLYKAQPDQYGTFNTARHNFLQHAKNPPNPLSAFYLIKAEVVRINAPVETWKTTDISLAPAIKVGATHIIVAVESMSQKEPNNKARNVLWIEYSPLGLHVNFDGKALYVMATDAAAGKPVSGAEVSLFPSRLTAKTDKDGKTKIVLNADNDNMLCCEFHSNTLMMPCRYQRAWKRETAHGTYRWHTNTDRNLYRPGETVNVHGLLRWQEWDANIDLSLPPPNTSVTYSVRQSDQTEITKGQIQLDTNGAFDFNFVLPKVMELGQCVVEFSVPSLNQNSSYTSNLIFQTQEFRRPEFEVSLKSDKPSITLGERSLVTCKGTYNTGSSLSHAKVHWKVQSASASGYTPPKLESYHFGISNQWWGRHGRIRLKENEAPTLNTALAELDGRTISDGTDAINVGCKSLAQIEPVTLNIEATLQDLNRQEWSEHTSISVFPSDLFVGMRTKNGSESFGAKENQEVELVVCNKDGDPVPDVAVDLEVLRQKEPSPTEQSDDADFQHEQTVKVISHSRPTSTTLSLTAGNYTIQAVVHDKMQRRNETTFDLHINTPPETEAALHQKKEQEKEWEKQELERVIKSVQITTDEKKYSVGQTAKVTIKAPFEQGHGVLFLTHFRTIEDIPFDISNSSATIPIRIDERFYPNVELNAYVASAYGVCGTGGGIINVPPDPFSLKVKAKAEANSYEPGQLSTVLIDVKDNADHPVANSAVAVAVVDESILELTGYRWTDPLSSFFNSSPEFMTNQQSNDFIVKYADLLSIEERMELLKHGFSPRDMNMFQVEPTVIDERHYTSGRAERHQRSDRTQRGADGSKMMYQHLFGQPGLVAAPTKNNFKLRSDLNPLAYYNPSVKTDEDGTARVTFKLPGNLTKYRIMAVAVKGAKQFGCTTESTFQTNMPLMVHPSLPRFLNFGDKAELTILLENKRDTDVIADLIVRSTNLILDASNQQVASMDGLAGRSVAIPAHDRVELRIPAEAKLGGEAVVQVAAVAGSSKDASELIIPLQPPITAEDFATYGQIDSGAIEQKISVPADSMREVGGLQISTSSTAMQRLLAPVNYLANYPFGCSEQISSRVLGMASMKSIAKMFPTAVSGITPDQMNDAIESGIAELRSRQYDDGSFAMWSKDERRSQPYPHVSIQCAKALFLAQQSGAEVPRSMVQNCLQYLQNIEQHIPSEYSTRESFSLRAFAINVRQQFGDGDLQTAARDLIHEAIELSLAERADSSNDQQKKKADPQMDLPRVMSFETLAWLYPVLSKDGYSVAEAAAIQNLIAARVSETSSTASIEGSPYGENSYLMFYSRSRSESVVLESLIAAQPSSDVIPKLVKNLLLGMNNGHWSNTQENSCALVALCKYFNTYEKAPPEFTALSWLGKDCILEEQFVGRSLDIKSLTIPMDYLQDHVKNDSLILQKDGPGRMYYRVGLRYALKDQNLPPTARGFSVSRKYEPVEANTDVRRDGDGKLHVKAGTTVKVTINIDAPGTRFHVAMSDPFPAGFEALNPELLGNKDVSDHGVAGRSESDFRSRRGWIWYEHQNLRDTRAEAFASRLYSGHYEYSYFAHATTPGVFIVPPCKVEEMYTPETFGRTSSEIMIID